MIAYPANRTERDRLVLGLRDRGPRPDPWRHQGLIVEEERDAEGGRMRSATVFLTGRECSWRCVMCDLWRQTIPGDTPRGAIAAQIAAARTELSLGRRRADERSSIAVAVSEPPVQLKLYNASSFFDPRAVPPDDYDAIAAALTGLRRVVVECHPALVGARVDGFLLALDRRRSGTAAPHLEVAMGLETAHPAALERLNKGMSVDDYVRACSYLLQRGVGIRTFVLIGPPFVAPGEAREWLFRSIETAIAAGSTVISLIPTRGGNGAMEQLAGLGQFMPVRLAEIEDAAAAAVTDYGRRARVFVDVWDLRRFAGCDACFDARVARLNILNLEQRVPPPCRCTTCEAKTS